MKRSTPSCPYRQLSGPGKNYLTPSPNLTYPRHPDESQDPEPRASSRSLRIRELVSAPGPGSMRGPELIQPARYSKAITANGPPAKKPPSGVSTSALSSRPSADPLTTKTGTGARPPGRTAPRIVQASVAYARDADHRDRGPSPPAQSATSARHRRYVAASTGQASATAARTSSAAPAR